MGIKMIKMADVFNVPVAVTNGDEHKNSTFFKGVPLLYSGSYGVNYRGIIGCVCFAELPDSGTSPKFEALKAANYAAIAINSYDANQALIAKQAEQNKMLREAVILARPYLFINSVEDSKAESALEATKDQA